MTSDSTMTASRPHPLSTRLIHAGLAISICLQLGTSLVMRGPTATTAGDLLFQLHRYSGFIALAFALAFWLTVAMRRRGTSAAVLFPWFSADRLRILVDDLREHLRSLREARFPDYSEDAPLASAIHGLGLLLMTAMAASGATYAIEVWTGLHSAEPDGTIAMTIHLALANLVWVYLIAHAGMAMIHHFLHSASLSRMWRFGS